MMKWRREILTTYSYPIPAKATHFWDRLNSPPQGNHLHSLHRTSKRGMPCLGHLGRRLVPTRCAHCAPVAPMLRSDPKGKTLCLLGTLLLIRKHLMISLVWDFPLLESKPNLYPYQVHKRFQKYASSKMGKTSTFILQNVEKQTAPQKSTAP